MKIEFVPRGSVSTLTLGDKAISSVDAARTHTALGDFVVRVRGDRRLETRAQRQDRVHIKQGGVTQFTGFLTVVRHRSSGETELRGKGIGKLLQENRPDYANLSNGTKTYDNVFAGDAIEDYWSLTQFGNVSVTKQTETIVVDDAQQRNVDTTSEWQNATQTIPDTEPVYIDSGKLKLAQNGFVKDVSGGESDADYSGGDAQQISDGLNLGIDFTFTTNYKIENPEVHIRAEVVTDEDIDSTQIEVDNTVEEFVNPSTTLSWVSDSINTLSAGQHTITVRPNQNIDYTSFNYDDINFDVIAVVDGEYTYNFDNTVNTSSGHLDGPELYAPDANPTVETKITTKSRNINNAKLVVTANDTSNDQRLGLSNDGGATISDFSNTTALTAAFTAAGRELVSQFRLSGYDNGAQSATPRFGYLGQEIDSFKSSLDLDDRIVLTDFELTKNHFDNLQKLHENSDYVWTIDHDDGDPANISVLSFPRGEESRTASDINTNEIDESPEVNSDRFYNKIAVQGGEDSNGDRPLAEVSDNNSISSVGDEITPGLLRDPTLNSEDECLFKAQALLKKALKNQDLRGQKVVPGSISLLPGASYSVGFLDDSPSEKVLEETRLRLSADGDAELTADFVAEETLRREIADLRRNQRQTADRL